MTTQVPSHFYRFENTLRVANDIASNNYYLFAADCLTHPNTTLQNLFDNQNDTRISAYRKMLFGKTIANTDVSFLINNYQYIANTVYTRYDDTSTILQNEQFFVIVNEGSFYHIWKCLDNNNGNPSTVSPSFAAGAGTTMYRTSDGYQWFYLTSVDSTTAGKFQTSSYFPIVANTSVANSAVPNCFDVISVDFQGSNYNNYLDGTFQSADLLIGGDFHVFNLSNSVAQSVNGYYTGCLLYLTGGVGQGQYKTVTDYVANSSGALITVDSPFLTAPVAGTTYELRPEVVVTPVDGIPTVNCVARALINATGSNSIYRVEVIKRGAGYITATANVSVNSVVGASNTAIVRPINGPYGGHGANSYVELYCNNLELSVSFTNSISNTIPTTNIYQQIGILKNPLFANVQLTLTTPTRVFSTNETISALTYSYLCGNVSSNTSNNQLVCTGTSNFVGQLNNGQNVLLIDNSGTQSQIVTVNNVVNSSAFNITGNVNFNSLNCTISSVNLISNAIVSSVVNSTMISITNASSAFSSPVYLYGFTSTAKAQISSVSRNDVSKAYNTFIQLYKYIGSTISGTFTQNETVVQGANTATFYGFDTANSGVLYLTNFSGVPFTTGQMQGNSSLAVANVTQQYVPEIVPFSGEILYVENINKVSRTNTQNETFQLILNF